MTTELRIDFVSDVSCPWCAIGLQSLQRAAKSLEGEVAVDLHFQPFELNPQMGAEGQDLVEHLTAKYGMPAQQAKNNQDAITTRGAALGFVFDMDKRSRIYNTFDAHRLLHWAELEGRQLELKKALLKAYFTDGQDPSNKEVLVQVAQSVGLDAERARAILDSEDYADEVREREQYFQQRGINSVPAIIINQRHLIQGGQPPEVFEEALRKIAQSVAEAAPE